MITSPSFPLDETATVNALTYVSREIEAQNLSTLPLNKNSCEFTLYQTHELHSL